MERGITGKLLKKWLQLIKQKQRLFVCAGVCVCVLCRYPEIYMKLFSADKIRSTMMMMMMENYSSSRNVLLSQKRVVIASESDSSPDKRTQRKGKIIPPLPPLPVLSLPPPSPSTSSTYSIAVASKSLFGSGTGGYNSKPTVSGKS